MAEHRYRSAAPPKRRVRRWLQFRLRTLMAAMTAACVFLAITDHYVEPWLVDRAAAKAIAEAGGSFESVPVGPDFLRTWLGPDVLQRITAVDLPHPEATAACLAHLPRLTWLKKATLTGAKFTDEHLTAISHVDRLRELTLRGTTVTADKVAQLSAERPDLKVTAEPLEISFADDLRFEEPKGKPFSRDHLTERIRCLDGSPVRIRGFMLPGFHPSGIRQFVLVLDNMK